MVVSSGQPFAATKIRQRNGHASDFWRLPFAAFQFLLWNKSPIICGISSPPHLEIQGDDVVFVVWFTGFFAAVFCCQSSGAPPVVLSGSRRKPEIDSVRSSFRHVRCRFANKKETAHIDLSSDRVTWLFKLYIGDYYATQLYYLGIISLSYYTLEN